MSSIIGAIAVRDPEGDLSIVAVTRQHAAPGRRLIARAPPHADTLAALRDHLITLFKGAVNANNQDLAHAGAYALIVVLGVSYAVMSDIEFRTSPVKSFGEFLYDNRPCNKF